MPKEIFGPDFAFRDRAELLTFEEIIRLAAIAVQLGVGKIRLTGGEPLLRRGLPTLIAGLAELRTPAGEPLDIALTTNGSALATLAPALRQAGLRRVTVSVDSLREDRFQAINDVGFPLARVLAAIDAATAAGLEPVKINTVLKRGVNDDEILDLVKYFRDRGHPIRFIEYMDVGSTNGWVLDDVVPSAEVIDTISARYPLVPLAPTQPGEVAKRWGFADGHPGEVGVISSVTNAFCGDCTRARISAEGQLFTCLFTNRGTDLRALLRGGATDAELIAVLARVWQVRDDRYSELRAAGAAPDPDRIEMSYIGG